MPFMAEFDHNVQELVPAATEHASNLQQTMDCAKRSLQAAQDRQQAYYNHNRPEALYHPHQWVLLSTKNFANGRGQKLMPKWMGPYQVICIIGSIAVILQLPDHMRCHNVFTFRWWNQTIFVKVKNLTIRPPWSHLILMVLRSGNWRDSSIIVLLCTKLATRNSRNLNTKSSGLTIRL